ncbi:MAG: restriction endonuclease subunit R [Deltaproteobacteria bacterium]|nr:restriction endonuclease subunit R [Deltaproteobacteria bacterium]
MQKLSEFIKEIQTETRFSKLDEAGTKQGIVLKILSLLEWDPFNIDEIHPEYPVGNTKVDFSLRHKNTDKVFIQVTKDTNDNKKHQEDLVAIAAKKGVKMATLTNGFTWWFFLPLLGDTLEEKEFSTLDLSKQKPQEAEKMLAEFLSRRNVTSGRAVKAGEEIYLTRQREMMIRENLPRAWEKLISEPEKWLVDMLADITKELSGYKPDKEAVEEFLASKIDAGGDIQAILKAKPAKTAAPPPKPKPSPGGPDYTGRSINSFTFLGKKYEVKSWKAMLLKLCNIIFPRHKEDLDIVLTLADGDREFFSKNPYEFLTGENIPGTDLYVDLNLKAMEVVDLSNKILSVFG